MFLQLQLNFQCDCIVLTESSDNGASTSFGVLLFNYSLVSENYNICLLPYGILVV